MLFDISFYQRLKSQNWLVVLHLLFSLYSTTGLYGQTASRSVHANFAYVGLSEPLDINLRHRRRIYLAGVGYNFSPTLSLNTQASIIRSNTADFPADRETGFQVSTTLEYDFLPSEKSRIYLGFGPAIGNYCSCGNLLPRIETDNLAYLKMDIGADVYLFPRISLLVGFDVNFILNNIPDKYNFNFPKVGLRLDRLLQMGPSRSGGRTRQR